MAAKSTEKCPTCGDDYKRLGGHWRWNQNHRPEMTDRQREIAIGLMMGDGCLHRGGKNPHLQVKMIAREYLGYVDNIFGCLGTGVSLEMTAKESAANVRESGFGPGAKEENYSDKYLWRSRSLPELHEFDWYTGSHGEKVWPEDIELTPTVLKHWYCGDGHYHTTGRNDRINIGMSNEVENTGKVDRYFERAGLPTPSNYNIHKSSTGGTNCIATFTIGDSKELFDYMGEPLPGFEYKWPET